jgi:hypothetical protein
MEAAGIAACSVQRMSSRHELVAAKNRARERHIELLSERLSIYLIDSVKFAESISSIRDRIRFLQDDPRTFEDSELRQL